MARSGSNLELEVSREHRLGRILEIVCRTVFLCCDDGSRSLTPSFLVAREPRARRGAGPKTKPHLHGPKTRDTIHFALRSDVFGGSSAVERSAVNRLVASSILARRAKKNPVIRQGFLLWSVPSKLEFLSTLGLELPHLLQHSRAFKNTVPHAKSNLQKSACWTVFSVGRSGAPRLLDRHHAHGLMMVTGRDWKSSVLRVTMLSPCVYAIAAICASVAGRVLPRRCACPAQRP